MKPIEVAWQEDHDKISANLASAKALSAAWEIALERTQNEANHAQTLVATYEGQLSKHESEKPEVDNETTDS